MSTQTMEPVEMGTKPIQEHEWLKNLIGEWRVETEMKMGPDGPTERSTGTESITSLGGLWAIGEGKTTMPGGSPMTYIAGLGYDVSFKEYRAFWVASVSSHLWKKAGNLSANGRVLTLTGEGPDMEKDGEIAYYRDVFELVDNDHFTMIHYGQNDSGEWTEYMTNHYTRK